MWFKSKYVRSLEEQLQKNELEISRLRQENSKLVERLLLKSGVPLAPDREPIDPKLADKLISSAAIFDDIMDDEEDEIVDNRKGSFDAFAQ